MKKIISILILILLLNACKEEQASTSENKSLLEQKQEIERQIDSLNRILVQIDKELGQTGEEEIPQITAMKLQPKAFTHYIELQGNVDTDGNVMVIPEAMGSVKKIYKNEGDKVRKGEIIALLDDSVLRNQISEVKTQYDLANTAYERQKRLWEQKIGSEMAYLQAKTKKEALARKLKTLYAQLAKFKVKAPISGTLDDLMIKEGEMAAPQKPVARIVNLDKVYMQADVSERYLPQIKEGSEVIIDFPEIGKQIQSNVSYVGNFIHPNNRTFKIRIDLLNLDGELKPNLTGNIKIKDYETPEAIVLPLALVQEDREGNNYVYVLQPVDGETDIYKVKKQIVELGKTYKNEVEIKSGLKPGDLLATGSARGLTEGDRVKIDPATLVNESSANQEEPQEQTGQEDVKYHVVKKGETLYRIHKKYGVSLADLRKWNNLKGNQVNVGQRLIVKK